MVIKLGSMCFNMILEHQMIQILTLWYLQHDSGTPMIQILTLWYLQHDSGTPNDSDTYTLVFTT